MRHSGTVALVCSRCDPHLPAWQELLLGGFAVAIALGLLYGVTRLGIFRVPEHGPARLLSRHSVRLGQARRG